MDQGCQFTREECTGLLKDHRIQIRMDGTGRWCGKVSVERLWRSLKCEEVCLHAYETVRDTRQGVAQYRTFCN
jgi:putative transposase